MNELHQHDLLPAVAVSVAATAGPGRRDHVLEIGAGTGRLTTALLDRGCRVDAIEIDPERLDGLRQRFASALAAGQLRIHGGDGRHLAPELPSGWRVIANPPFRHSAELWRRWLLEDLPGGPPRAIDLVCQFQTALKWCGDETRHTRSSILAHLAGTPRISKRLRRQDVEPISHVDLCCWSWRRHPDAPDPALLRAVDHLLASGLAGPHSVQEALRPHFTRTQLRRQASEQHWRLDAHPATLPPRAWLALARFAQGL